MIPTAAQHDTNSRTTGYQQPHSTIPTAAQHDTNSRKAWC